MVIHLDGSVEQAMLEKLMEAYNELGKSIDPQEAMLIYLSSTGGDMAIAGAIVHLINIYKERTHLVGYCTLQSAAIKIFFEVQCSKELDKCTYGMFHLASWLIDTLAGNVLGCSLERFKKDFLKKIGSEQEIFFNEVGLNEAEIASIKSGEDLYLMPKRMEQLLKYHQKNRTQ